MTDFMPQGYPFYAAARATKGEEPAVRAVVGWVRADDDVNGTWHPLVVFESFALALPEELVVYLGPDLAAARAEVPAAKGAATAARASQSHGRPSGVVRYARGATALCGLLNGHEAHQWTPDGHDYPIACTGAPS